MSNMDNCQKDLLDNIGRFISYSQMLVFTILLLYSCHFTYNATYCPFDIAHRICVLFTILVLITISAMFILAFILALGISLRQADCLRPWLLMTVVMSVLGVAFLTLSTDFSLITLGAMVLVLQIISWYPIYRLYHRYCSEIMARSQSVEESYPLSGESECRASYRADYLKTPSEDPPSYDTVMGMDANPPCFEDKSILVWSNDMNAKTRIQKCGNEGRPVQVKEHL